MRRNSRCNEAGNALVAAAGGDATGMPLGDHTPLRSDREIFVEQGAPLVPQVVAFVGLRALIAAHLGTVATAYALWLVAMADFEPGSELAARPDDVGLHLHAVGRGAERTAGNTPHGDVLTPGPLIEVARFVVTNEDRARFVFPSAHGRRTPPERQQR
jgi:hypothetical protein